MDKIDKIFKEALGNQSEPFDPSSWDAISKRLDAQMPSKQNPFLKWGIPGAAVVVCTSVALWYFSSNSNEKSAKESDKTENDAPRQLENTPEKSLSENLTKPSPKVQNSNTSIVPVAVETTNQGPIPVIKAIDELSTSGSDVVTADTQSKEKAPLELKNNSNPINSIDSKVYQPIVLQKCADEEALIENKNDFDICLVGAKFYLQIPANSGKKIQIKETGAIEVFKMQAGKLAEKAIQTQWVKKPFSTEVQLEDVNYSNGLPVKGIHLKTESNIQNIQINHKNIGKTSKDLEINIFEAGQYQLKVNTIDETGCNNVISENFYVSDAYNLLAVNAFDPYASDIRKNTFLPYALTKRNTPFKMVILDPSDGGLVFETMDVNLPWDGTDRRNGKMVETNKAFIWKVTLVTPEIGEKSDYLGTVVRM